LTTGFGAALTGVGTGLVTGALAGAALAFERGVLAAAGFFATGFGAGAFFFVTVLEAAFLTGFFGSGFFAGADLAFFFGAGLEAAFLDAAGFFALPAGGLALPWAAFVLVGLDLLTV
jgi:hypothetical protein